MGEFTVVDNAAADLAEIVVVGIVGTDEVTAFVRNNPGFMRRRRHLADLSQVDIHLIDPSALTQISTVLKELERECGRSRGRTAIVAPTEAVSWISRLYAGISEGVGRQVEFKITSSRGEALSWLTEQDA